MLRWPVPGLSLRWGARVSAFLVLSVHAGLLAWSIPRQSPTADEPFHLAAGLRRLLHGKFDVDLGNPPLAGTIAALPVMLAKPETDWRGIPSSFRVGSDFLRANGARSFWLIAVARWACIPLSLLGAYVCYRWARELYGAPSGVLALVMWCFCPNVLAHGQLVTADMAATALGLAAFYAFWKWLNDASWSGAAVAGAALGLAELSKFVWVVLYLVWPLLWMISAGSQGISRFRRAALRQSAQLALILLMATNMTNLGYLCDGSFQPLGEYYFASERLHRIVGSTGNNSLASFLPSLPVPFPANYVRGIDQVTSFLEGAHGTYLRGTWSEQGVWYYYLYGLFIKVPLGTWLIGFTALVSPLAGRRYSAGWRSELLVLAPPLVVLFFVSALPGYQSHVRYVLPGLPFLFVWASKTARAFARKDWPFTAIVCTGVAWLTASSLWVYPHSLSYFNELVGGPRRGHEHLLDSNIDWGQDLLYLKRWLDEHPGARPFYLTCSAAMDPRLAGIDFLAPSSLSDPVRPRPSDDASPSVLQPGWHAASVNMLHGAGFSVADGRGGVQDMTPAYFASLLRREPVAMAGYSIYIYHITLEEANRVRREMGLEEVRSGGSAEFGARNAE